MRGGWSWVSQARVGRWGGLSAASAGQDSQRFSVNWFVQEREAGRAERAVAPGVHVSHQHVVQAWTERKRREKMEVEAFHI